MEDLAAGQAARVEPEDPAAQAPALAAVGLAPAEDKAADQATEQAAAQAAVAELAPPVGVVVPAEARAAAALAALGPAQAAVG